MSKQTREALSGSRKKKAGGAKRPFGKGRKKSITEDARRDLSRLLSGYQRGGAEGTEPKFI